MMSIVEYVMSKLKSLQCCLSMHSLYFPGFIEVVGDSDYS